MVFDKDGDPLPSVIIYADSYINLDGYLVCIFEGEHYASPTKELPRICLDYPVPLDKRKEGKCDGENND